MLFTDDHDRQLAVTQRFDFCLSTRFGGNVDDGVIKALVIQRAIGGSTLYTGRLAINLDFHGYFPFS